MPANQDGHTVHLRCGFSKQRPLQVQGVVESVLHVEWTLISQVQNIALCGNN